MQNQSLKSVVKELLPNRYIQISESHCGPAVIQMLLAHVGVITSQEKITEEAGAVKTIETHGTRVDQLAKAVKKIAPQLIFWQKEKAEIDDIRILINEFKFPVAVEWQGLFETGGFTITSEREDDYGHYSIVTYIDDKNLVIVDPYKDFASQDRVFNIKDFLPRWWDTNEMDENDEKRIKKDEKLLFIVTPENTIFPEKLNMQKL